jgi:hypothetical protein
MPGSTRNPANAASQSVAHHTSDDRSAPIAARHPSHAGSGTVGGIAFSALTPKPPE